MSCKNLKTKLTTVAAIAAFTCAYGFDVASTNFSVTEGFFPVVDSTGAPLDGTATVYIGSFGDLSTTDIANAFNAGTDLLTIFDQFGSFAVQSGGAPVGFFSSTPSGSVPVGGALDGNQITTLIKTATGEALVLLHSGANNIFVNDSNPIAAGEAKLFGDLPLIGTYAQVQYEPNPTIGLRDAYQTSEVIPEPSTYFLMALGLGVIGFVTRRRK